MRYKALVLSVLMLIMPARVGNSDDNTSMSVEQAIQIVVNDHSDTSAEGSSQPSEFEAHYRLESLLDGDCYEYKDTHADAWLKLMRDEKQSMYPRLSAAYFLLEQNKEARQFIVSQLKSKNLRHRYNAAEIVRLHVGRNPEKKWGIRILLGLLADGSIDVSKVRRPPFPGFPEVDRYEIIENPVDQICWDLGIMKEQEAVPALISILKRRPETDEAIDALGEIGDKQAIPLLMHMLKNRIGSEYRVVVALGKLKHKEAIPILASCLDKPRKDRHGKETIGAWTILDAFSQIGDKRAIGPIEKYLEGDHPARCKAIARRVLIQFKSPDPVKDLLALLEKETSEWERSEIISTLARYPDRRVVDKFASIARTSDSAYMRRQAILGLRDLGNRQALLALSSLLDLTFPKNLKAKHGWKVAPDFEKYFPEKIQKCLKQCTKQDFSNDSEKWTKWIEENVEPKGAVDKK